MDIKKLNLQDLESYFNLVSKIRDTIIMMARANNNSNTPQFKLINDKYNMLYNEILSRIENLNESNIKEKEVLND